MAAPQTSTPAEVLDQAVEHARLTARGGAPEIEILLRPESLGHLRMRVSTDNRQVTVRILAEKASAAEIMEDHVAQLKADLQAAGLEMERFEVSVARDALDFRTEGRTAALTGSGGNAAAADTPAGQNDGKGSPMLAGDGFAPAGRIDFFV
jgi:flagellar hook-length control protein FliK